MRALENQQNIDPLFCGPSSQKAQNKVRKGVFQVYVYSGNLTNNCREHSEIIILFVSDSS